MYRGHRVVAFIPAGRRSRMSVLLDYLQLHRQVVDEVQVWLNTDESQVEDRAWLEQLPLHFPGWVNTYAVEPHEVRQPKQYTTGRFYRFLVSDEPTIAIRFDDDIVYVHDDFFTNLVDYRLDHPKPLLVMANIWNNAVNSWYHQHKLGTIGTQFGEVGGPYCMDQVGWASPAFAHYLHEELLAHVERGSVDSLLFDGAYQLEGRRFSISCFAVNAADVANWGGSIEPLDEEIYLTETLPAQLDRPNVVCGGALVSHFSFFSQRESLENSGILDRYRDLAHDRLSREYYALLGAQS